MQGLTHLWFWLHASKALQSEFNKHSGLHSSLGSPIKFLTHEQTAALFWTLQTLFEPHGEGLQGSLDGILSSRR